MANFDPLSKESSLERLKRRWFPLWILDSYILKEFLIKYFLLLLVFIILFILGDVYRYCDDFLEAKATPIIIFEFLLNKLPGNIRFVLPISMLLGCMWTMATFGKNLEVTAMRASGVSLFRCGGPIFFVGILVTCVNIYFNELLIPKTERKAEMLRDVHAKGRRYVQSLLTYSSTDQQRNWLFQVFSSKGRQENVNLKTYWNDSYVAKFIGEVGTPKFNKMVNLVLEHKAKKILSLPIKDQKAALDKELRGRKLDIYSKVVDFSRKKEEWTFFNGSFTSYDRNDETRIRASRGISIIHEPIEFEKITFSTKEIPETPYDIINSIKEKDDLPTIVIYDLVKKTPNMAERVKNIYMTVFYYRLAFPWACFLAVFLGIPLATKNERTGSLLAIVTAVGIIIVYIVSAQIFMVLGKGGFIPPIVAGLAPTIGFIACGIWRVIKDHN